MHPSDGHLNGHTPRPTPKLLRGHDAAEIQSGEVWGWSANRLWGLAFALCALIATVDALLGHRVILIALLAAGPCCALFTGRWSRTAVVGVLALGLAVALGVPDHIWGTAAHFAFVGSVFMVSVVASLSAAAIERLTPRR